jgi:hypothetical protein
VSTSFFILWRARDPLRAASMEISAENEKKNERPDSKPNLGRMTSDSREAGGRVHPPRIFASKANALSIAAAFLRYFAGAFLTGGFLSTFLGLISAK